MERIEYDEDALVVSNVSKALYFFKRYDSDDYKEVRGIGNKQNSFINCGIRPYTIQIGYTIQIDGSLYRFTGVAIDDEGKVLFCLYGRGETQKITRDEFEKINYVIKAVTN